MGLTKVKTNMIDGSTGGGAENLITDGAAESASVSIFTPYADAAGTRPVDGTGGTPNVTTSLSTTNPINGLKDFRLIKDAANRQGEGWAVTPISIPLAYRAKSLKLSIKTLVTSGTFVPGNNGPSPADGDVIWYVYDITNSKLVEPSNIKMFSNATDVSDTYEATVQFDYNTASVRLIAHVASTSALAYTLQVDDVTLTPEPVATGTPSVSFSAFKSGGDSNGSSGVVSFTSVDETHNGFNLTTGEYTVKVPGDYIVGFGDEWAAPQGVGFAFRINGAVVSSYSNSASSVYDAGGFLLRNLKVGDVLSVSSSTGSALSLTSFYFFGSKVAGQSQASEAGNTRAVSCYKIPAVPTGTINGGYNAVVWSAVSNDTHNGYNATTGRYTVKVPGFYRVRATLDINGTFTVGQYIGVKVGNITTGDVYYNFWKAQGSVTGDYPVSVTGTVYAKAGDILGVDSISSGSSLSYSASLSNSDFSYDLCQGPQAIAASEKITAIYKTSAGQALGAGVVLIDFGTLEEDSHNCVTTGAAWKFTAKTNRIYKVSGALRIDTAGRRVDLYKNGSYYRTLFEPSGASETVSFHTGLRLNSGDYIDIRAQSGSAAAVYADDKFNYVLVEAN